MERRREEGKERGGRKRESGRWPAKLGFNVYPPNLASMSTRQTWLQCLPAKLGFNVYPPNLNFFPRLNFFPQMEFFPPDGISSPRLNLFPQIEFFPTNLFPQIEFLPHISFFPQIYLQYLPAKLFRPLLLPLSFPSSLLLPLSLLILPPPLPLLLSQPSGLHLHLSFFTQSEQAWHARAGLPQPAAHAVAATLSTAARQPKGVAAVGRGRGRCDNYPLQCMHLLALHT